MTIISRKASALKNCLLVSLLANKISSLPLPPSLKAWLCGSYWKVWKVLTVESAIFLVS